jgi:hypothetical protein
MTTWELNHSCKFMKTSRFTPTSFSTLLNIWTLEYQDVQKLNLYRIFQCKKETALAVLDGSRDKLRIRGVGYTPHLFNCLPSDIQKAHRCLLSFRYNAANNFAHVLVKPVVEHKDCPEYKSFEDWKE